MLPSDYLNILYCFTLFLPLFSTARQAVKNTPKRLPSVSVRSPLGASPPTMDSQTDSLVPTPPMDSGGVPAEDTNTHPVVRRTLFFFVFFCFLTITFCHLASLCLSVPNFLLYFYCLSGPGSWGVSTCDRRSRTRTQRWRPGCISR